MRVAGFALALLVVAAAVLVAVLRLDDDEKPLGVGSIRVGMTKEDVLSRAGKPLRVVGAECWQYKETPAWDAYFVDVCFEGTGHVVRLHRLIHG